MVEALNRKLKYGDIVVVKKGSFSEDFSIGVIIGKGGVVIDNSGQVFNSYRTCYMLENPTDYEHNVAKLLLEGYHKNRRKAEKELKSKKQEIGYTSLKDTKIGDYGYLVSANRNKKTYVYLGKVDAYYGKLGNMCLSAEAKSRLSKNECKIGYYAYAYIRHNCKLDSIETLSEDMIQDLKIVKNRIPFIKDGILGNVSLDPAYSIMTINGKANLVLKK